VDRCGLADKLSRESTILLVILLIGEKKGGLLIRGGFDKEDEGLRKFKSERALLRGSWVEARLSLIV